MRDQIGKPHFQMRRDEFSAFLHFLRKHWAPGKQRVVQVASGAAQIVQLRRRADAKPVVEIFARHKTQRCDANRTRAASPQPAPRKLPRKRQFIEPLSTEIPDARRKNLLLPSMRCNLVTGKLPKHLRDAARPLQSM